MSALPREINPKGPAADLVRQLYAEIAALRREVASLLGRAEPKA